MANLVFARPATGHDGRYNIPLCEEGTTGKLSVLVYSDTKKSCTRSAKIFCAGEDLLAACQEYIKQYNGNSTPVELYKMMVAAVDKATK